MEGVIDGVERVPEETRLAVDLVANEASPARVVLLVSPATEVTVRLADGTRRPADAAELSAGMRIVARHAGPELRSLPPQYRATHVEVLSRR
jgi:hypothetical protein